jgi:hypothetical protein
MTHPTPSTVPVTWSPPALRLRRRGPCAPEVPGRAATCWRSSSTSTAWPRPSRCRWRTWNGADRRRRLCRLRDLGRGHRAARPRLHGRGRPAHPLAGALAAGAGAHRLRRPRQRRALAVRQPRDAARQIDRLTPAGWTLFTGLEPEFSLLKRGVNGKVEPCDASDTLAKPCYDYKGLSRTACSSSGCRTPCAPPASTSTRSTTRTPTASSRSTTPTPTR